MFSLTVLSAWLLGCSAAPLVDFTWYHPQGGEHLFAFDQEQCEAQVLAAGQVMGSNPEGLFFHCMGQRGYLLISDVQMAMQFPAFDLVVVEDTSIPEAGSKKATLEILKPNRSSPQVSQQ